MKLLLYLFVGFIARQVDRFKALPLAVKLPIEGAVSALRFLAGLFAFIWLIQLSVIGFSRALRWAVIWIAVLLLLAAILALICILFATVSTGVIRLGSSLLAKIPPQRRETARRLVRLLVWSSVACLLGWAAIDMHLAKRRLSTSPQAQDARALLTEAQWQERELLKTVESAEDLIGELDKRQADLQRTREQIVSLLLAMQSQRVFLLAVQSDARKLGEHQDVLLQQSELLRTALEGRQPITLDDLNDSQMSGLLLGLVIGIASSIIGAYCFEVFKRLVRNTRENEEEHVDQSHS